jgi:hypothetical protein
MNQIAKRYTDPFSLFCDKVYNSIVKIEEVDIMLLRKKVVFEITLFEKIKRYLFYTVQRSNTSYNISLDHAMQKIAHSNFRDTFFIVTYANGIIHLTQKPEKSYIPGKVNKKYLTVIVNNKYDITAFCNCILKSFMTKLCICARELAVIALIEHVDYYTLLAILTNPDTSIITIHTDTLEQNTYKGSNVVLL